MLEKKSFSIEWAGKQLTLETGALAGQADGAVTVRYGDTVILATATMGTEPRAGINYFPLMVDYEERLYAAGKIKGSRFIKREGRPSDEEILTGRLIDRSIRPLFKDTIRNDVQVAILVLSSDMENDADILGLLGASAALAISPIPWGGPLSGVRVGRINGEWAINPTFAARKKSDLDLLVAGRDQEAIMIESGAAEVNETDMVQAIEFALKHLQKPLELIRQMQAEVGVAKRKPDVEEVDAEAAARADKIKQKVAEFLQKELKGIYNLAKIEREEAITNIKEKLDATLKEDNDVTKEEREVGLKMVEAAVDVEARRLVLDEGKRVDGRAIDEIRPLSAAVGILPRTHGTGLFQRGETQVLSIVTLGSPGDQQILENIDEAQEFKKHYMHHYYFPGWSVGEVKPNRGPGRREIGHGALAEKAIMPVLPDRELFPYTIRVVSEVLSSNGSTSQASACGSTLALMDAGVPIKRPVAGIAMGLITEVKEKNDGRPEITRWKVLTDIQGVEDHAGDMDFKVAGTSEGITAIQLDIKVQGITMDIVREAITGARTARGKILEVMAEAIAVPRAEMSPYAPRIHVLHIHPDKIRLVIGPGGKMINEITDKTGVTIDIEDDGSIFVTSPNQESADKAIEMINAITREIEPGEIITGKVSRIMDFGAIVDLTPTQDGMVHISELEAHRVDQVSDVLKLGEEVKVKVLSVEDGRISLSIKQVKYPDLPPSAPRGNGGGDRRRPRF